MSTEDLTCPNCRADLSLSVDPFVRGSDRRFPCPRCGAMLAPAPTPDSVTVPLLFAPHTPKQEVLVLTLLAEAWNAFVNLAPAHSDEVEEFKCAIHAAQTLIMARAAYRESPNLYKQAGISHRETPK